MATPTSIQLLNFGDRDGCIGTFTTIANNDTWVTPFSAIEHVEIMNAGGDHTLGYTVSGGTITFKVGAGDATTGVASVLVIGFN